jgi:hypothetical protein
MNGAFLVVLGLVRPHLRLHALLLRTGYWLALVGTYLNWAVHWPPRPGGAGDTTMPLAAGGHLGAPDQELTLLVGLRALSALPRWLGAFYVKCCIAVIDSQKLCGLNCGREQRLSPGAGACKYGPMTLPQPA